MDLLIGTNNKGKYIEIADALSSLPVSLLSLHDAGIDEIPEETGETFEENAIQKAKFFSEKTSMPVIADDSGIMVDALKNELGIHTRRWGPGADASDEEWIELFLKRMENEPNKRAKFVCAIAFNDSDGNLFTFSGSCEGRITESLEAPYLPGLPISSCFIPDGYDCVFSALNTEQKNSTSHRGKAVKKFYEHLCKILK